MNRKVQALETLRRIEERELDTISRQLCAARNAQNSALNQVEQLHQRAIQEARCTMQEALPYVGKFLATIRREQNYAWHQARALDDTIATLHDQVVERFATEKTYSTLKDQLVDQIKLERMQKDDAQLDDMASVKFIRDLAS